MTVRKAMFQDCPAKLLSPNVGWISPSKWLCKIPLSYTKHPFWKFSSMLSSWPQCRQKTTKQMSRAVRVKNGDWTLQNICVSSFSMLIYAYLLKYHWKNAETPETTKRNKQLFNCSRFKFVSIAGIPISVAKSTFCGHKFMSFAQSVGREHHQKLGLSQLASHSCQVVWILTC